ncbi:MAG: hypothetical protein WKF44_01660 [Rubrobacteraceae bacterium]
MSVRDTGGFDRAVGQLGEAYLAPYRAAVDHAFRVRESNSRLTREFFTSHVALMEEHATLNQRTAREAFRLTREQSEALLALSMRRTRDPEDFFSA